MKKRLIACALACLLLCSAFAELPEPEKLPQNMILGETWEESPFDVTLYRKDGESTELVPVARTVWARPGIELIRRTLGELLRPASDDALRSPAPSDTAVRSCRLSRKLVTVDLQIDPATLSGLDLVTLHSAVTNTLCALDGVEHVQLLLNSRPLTVAELPVGVSGTVEEAVSVQWAQRQAEADRSLGMSYLERDVALYFPTSNGQWVLPEVRKVSFSGGDYVRALLDQLILGPQECSVCSGFLSGVASVLTQEPTESVNAYGLRVLELNLSGATRDYMLLQGFPEWQLAACLSQTLCAFVPDVDAVRILIDGQPMTPINVRGAVREFPDGVIRRDDFDMYIGDVADLCFTNGNGRLQFAERSMSTMRTESAVSLLVQLISGPSATDAGVYGTMPSDVSTRDILGANIAGGVATVNFSADFYRKCQILDAGGERLLVYSIVNTLCTLPGVQTVRFLFEGEQVQTLSQSIYLMGELLPNPGIMGSNDTEPNER